MSLSRTPRISVSVNATKWLHDRIEAGRRAGIDARKQVWAHYKRLGGGTGYAMVPAHDLAPGMHVFHTPRDRQVVSVSLELAGADGELVSVVYRDLGIATYSAEANVMVSLPIPLRPELCLLDPRIHDIDGARRKLGVHQRQRTPVLPSRDLSEYIAYTAAEFDGLTTSATAWAAAVAAADKVIRSMGKEIVGTSAAWVMGDEA